MNRSGLVSRLAEGCGIGLESAAKVVDIFFGGVADALAMGDRVEVRGFGSFKSRSYKGYTGRNPRTGEAIEVKPKTLPVFRASREITRKLQESLALRRREQ